MKKDPLIITDDAQKHIMALMDAKKGDRPIGLRIGLETKGCSGLRYQLSYAYEEEPFEEKMTLDDLAIYIHPKAIMYILGSEMDYEQTDTSEGFVFRNPNEKGKCGCGESFHV